MKVIFSIYCYSANQAKRLAEKLEKIQIKNILMVEIIDINNKIDRKGEYNYIINMLTEIRKIDYMLAAIMEKIDERNMIEYYEVIYL